MRALSELFEFLSHCDNPTLLEEIREHGRRIADTNSRFQSEIVFRFDLEKLNTLLRLSEYYLSVELPRIIKEQEKQSNPDELYLKVTTQTVYTLLSKGKLKRVEISTVDRPGVRPAVRIRKMELERFLESLGTSSCLNPL